MIVLTGLSNGTAVLADDDGPFVCSGNRETAAVIAHLGDERIVVRRERVETNAGAIELTEYRVTPDKQPVEQGKTTILSSAEVDTKTAGKLRGERWRLAEQALKTRGFSLVALPYVATLEAGVMLSTQHLVTVFKPVAQPGDPAFESQEKRFFDPEMVVHDETGRWQRSGSSAVSAIWVAPSRKFLIELSPDDCQGTELRVAPVAGIGFTPEPAPPRCDARVTTSIVGFIRNIPLTRAEQTGTTNSLTLGATDRVDVSGTDPAQRAKRWDEEVKRLSAKGATFTLPKPIEALPGGWKVAVRVVSARVRIDEPGALRFVERTSESSSLIAFRPGTTKWKELQSVPTGATVSDLRLSPDGKAFAVALSGPCVRPNAGWWNLRSLE